MKASGTIGATGILAALLCLTLTAVVEAHDTTGAATVLGSQNARFTINGEATFLLGISYYGALGASEDFIQQDLDDLQRHGFNWLRVWATWAAFENDISAVNANGSPGEPFLAKLKWLVAECDRRGMIVDVTPAASEVLWRSGQEMCRTSLHTSARLRRSSARCNHIATGILTWPTNGMSATSRYTAACLAET